MNKKKNTSQAPPDQAEAAPDNRKSSVPLEREAPPTLDVPTQPDHHMEVDDDGGPLKLIPSQPATDNGKGAVPDGSLPQPEVSAPATESGKAALPDYEDENDPAGYGSDGEDDPDPVFTQQDEMDFPVLEARVNKGTRETFTALREIRRRKLFKLVKDEEDKSKYKRFDAYVEDRFGHKRQWVTHGTNWLRILETLETLGVKDPPPLTVDAAQGLLPGRLDGAGGLLEVLREAQEDGVALTKDNLREIVVRRADYNFWSKTDGPNKPAAASYAEYKQDCLTVKKLGKDGKGQLVYDARQMPGDLLANLVKLCKERKALPRADDLPKVATGPDLEKIVEALLTVARTVADVEEKRNLLATRKKQIKAMQQEGTLKALKDEAKALEEELRKGGHLTKKKGGADEGEAGDGEGGEDEEGQQSVITFEGGGQGEGEPEEEAGQPSPVEEEPDAAPGKEASAPKADKPGGILIGGKIVPYPTDEQQVEYYREQIQDYPSEFLLDVLKRIQTFGEARPDEPVGADWSEVLKEVGDLAQILEGIYA